MGWRLDLSLDVDRAERGCLRVLEESIAGKYSDMVVLLFEELFASMVEHKLGGFFV